MDKSIKFLLAALFVSACFLVVSRYWQQLSYYVDDVRHSPREFFMLGTSSIKKIRALPGCLADNFYNRGFYNSDIDDLLVYALVAPERQLRWVILYAGENHIVKHNRVEHTIARYQLLVDRVRAKFESANILMLGVKPAPSRKLYWQQFDALNTYLKKVAQKDEKIFYHQQIPKNERDYFIRDGVHLSELGYRYFLPDMGLLCDE